MDFFIWSYTEQGLVVPNMPYSTWFLSLVFLGIAFMLWNTYAFFSIYKSRGVVLLLLVGIEFMKWNTHTFLNHDEFS